MQEKFFCPNCDWIVISNEKNIIESYLHHKETRHSNLNQTTPQKKKEIITCVFCKKNPVEITDKGTVNCSWAGGFRFLKVADIVNTRGARPICKECFFKVF